MSSDYILALKRASFCSSEFDSLTSSISWSTLSSTVKGLYLMEARVPEDLFLELELEDPRRTLLVGLMFSFLEFELSLSFRTKEAHPLEETFTLDVVEVLPWKELELACMGLPNPNSLLLFLMLVEEVNPLRSAQMFY